LKHLKKFYIFIILLFLYAPIVVLIVFSFNASRSRANWTGFTFSWYLELFKDQRIINALNVTLTVALISSLIAVVLGTAAAIGINAMRPLGKKTFIAINNIPVINPDIVMGISMMILFIFIFRFSPLKLEMGYLSLLLAHLSFNTPYVVLSVLPRLRHLDENLYEAALDLGAPPLKSFLHVIMPEISPGIITGALLAFTMSIDDFIVSFFTSGSGVENLSMVIYSMARRGVSPKINAISTLMFIFVITLLYLVNRIDTRNKEKETLS